MLCPSGEVAVAGDGHAEVGIEFFVDVLQGGGDSHPSGHAETEPHGFPWVVVRILPQDDYFDLLEGGSIESVEDQAAGRIDDLSLGFFLFDEGDEIIKKGLFEEVLQDGFPGFFNIYVGHGGSVLRDVLLR